ncbi:hypothetical protein, partial [Sporomusa ovata]|uniref:hypothetical protein n=1 Tax=Sporomusa ovata TaxID=2378 RepID=UPI001C6FC67E
RLSAFDLRLSIESELTVSNCVQSFFCEVLKEQTFIKRHIESRKSNNSGTWLETAWEIRKLLVDKTPTKYVGVFCCRKA